MTSDKRVLLVEDDVFSRRGLERLLTDEGYEVDACEGPTPALELLGQRRYAALLTDHVMPGMTGLELARVCHEQYPETRCVVMSGYPPPEPSVRAHVTWLSKPLELELLLVTLAT